MSTTNIARTGLVLGVLSVLCPLALAQQPEAAPEAVPAVKSDDPVFNYQTGEVVLPNKVATLHLGGSYRYLDPNETEKLLVAWGNQAGNETQGAIVANDVDPMSGEGWAVILTYSDDGHVDDSDAAKMDFEDLLSDMQKGTEEENAERKKAGYGAVHLVGWAEKPHYDSASKKLYWAKELDFEGSSHHELNYCVRVLGRKGVLQMNAVSGIGQLSQIRSDMQSMIRVAEFNSGQRYADYDSKTDRLAEYGLGALIAGGVAAKLGLFAKLGAILAASWKFVMMGLVALGGFLSRLFGKKKDSAA